MCIKSDARSRKKESADFERRSKKAVLAYVACELVPRATTFWVPAVWFDLVCDLVGWPTQIVDLNWRDTIQSKDIVQCRGLVLHSAKWTSSVLCNSTIQYRRNYYCTVHTQILNLNWRSNWKDWDVDAFERYWASCYCRFLQCKITSHEQDISSMPYLCRIISNNSVRGLLPRYQFNVSKWISLSVYDVMDVCHHYLWDNVAVDRYPGRPSINIIQNQMVEINVALYWVKKSERSSHLNII